MVYLAIGQRVLHTAATLTSNSLYNVQMKMKIKHLTNKIKMVNQLNKWPQLLVACFLLFRRALGGRRLKGAPPSLPSFLPHPAEQQEKLSSHTGHHSYPKQPRIYVSVLERNKYSASGDTGQFKSLPRETAFCNGRALEQGEQ